MGFLWYVFINFVEINTMWLMLYHILPISHSFTISYFLYHLPQRSIWRWGGLKPIKRELCFSWGRHIVKHVYSRHAYNALMLTANWFSFHITIFYVVNLTGITNYAYSEAIRPSLALRFNGVLLYLNLILFVEWGSA